MLLKSTVSCSSLFRKVQRRSFNDAVCESESKFVFVGGKYRKSINAPTLSPDKNHALSDREKWLLKSSIEEVNCLLEDKVVTSAELCEASLKQIRRMSFTNAFITVKCKSHIMAEARSYDSGDASPSIMKGIPVAIKDNYAVKDMPTTCASQMLKNFIAPYDSTVSKRLEDGGIIVVGKTNLDEFGMGNTTTNSIYGPTINPWSQVVYEKTNDIENSLLSAGGSSGGSAVAVASKCVWAATATDTGGSSRLPASLTGTVGYKPSYGYSSRYGIVKYASSLDCPALIARTVGDIDLLRKIIVGLDPLDSTSVQLENKETEKHKSSQENQSEQYVIGIPAELNILELSDSVRDTWLNGIRFLKERNCKIVNISLPHTSEALNTYHVIASAEAASNLCKFDGVRYGIRGEGTTVEELYKNTRSIGFGKEVLSRIILGTYVLSHTAYDSFYRKAVATRSLIKRDFDNVFKNGIDAVLTPVSITESLSISEIQNMTSNEYYTTDIMTVSANLAKIPAISVPFELSENGLPQGLQLMGAMFEDAKLVRIAKLLEENWISLRTDKLESFDKYLL